MARWPLPITLFALSATAAVSAPGDTEVIQVPPGVPAENRVPSETVFRKGHSYRIKVSGTITAKSQTETLVFSAFHCLQGCPGSVDHAYYPHLRIYDKADGTALTPLGLDKDGKAGDYVYNAEGKYVLTFDNFAKDMRLEWAADPHGKNPDAYGRYYSGPGFRVEIEENRRIVAFKFQQQGLPKKPPREMISSEVGVKGSILLPDVDFDNRGEVNGDPRGSAVYVAINESKDHLVVFRPVDGSYVQTDDRRVVTLKLKVRESNVPACDKGARAVIRLADTTVNDDYARLGSNGCDLNELLWTRKSSDEFRISISKPQ